MKKILRPLWLSFALTPLQAAEPPPGFDAVDHDITITTLSGQMKYDRESFNVSAGSKVKLTLKNIDEMPHNIVFALPGDDEGKEIADAALLLGGLGFNKHWIPEHKRIIAYSKMVDPHKSESIYFKAPEKEDDYPYLCTVPGHFFLMKGVMKVGSGAAPQAVASKGASDLLQDLTFKVYKGTWNKLPDFGALKPAREGTASKGIVNLADARENENFGVVYQGKLILAEGGSYAFSLGSDDGSRLIIDGRTVIDNDGIHGTTYKSGKATLDAGEHAVEVQYFEKSGQETLFLSYTGPGGRKVWLSPQGGGGGGGVVASGIPIKPPAGEAIIYRNFIEGAGPRAIGVGYPEQINLAFDANRMALAMIWQGLFMDGKKHWTGRGQGFQPPSGYGIIKMPGGAPFALELGPDETWPTPEKRVMDRFEGYRFLGYRLNKQRFPTFHYSFHGVKISDFPSGTGAAGVTLPHIARTFECTPNGAVKSFWYRAASGQQIEASDDGLYRVDGAYKVSLSGVKPELRKSGNSMELLVKVDLSNGPATFVQKYYWP
ncbi:MAG: PA14 domain-containing protein [Verrucomicrobiota bacterium]